MRIPNQLLVLSALFASIASALGTTPMAYSAFGGMDVNAKAALTINADGTAKLLRESVQSREQAEQLARMYSRMLNRGDDEDETTPPELGKAAENAEPKPLTDAELEKQIRASVDASEDYGLDQGKIEKLDISKDEVKITRTKTYANLEEMLGHGYVIWSQLMYFENVRMEKDADGRLKMTFTPRKMPARYITQMAKALRASKMKTEMRMTFPGKIISSGFPETTDNTTGFTIDAAKAESVDLISKLSSEPVIIVAELGGLKLDQPIESRGLQQAIFLPRSPNVSNIPITEGGEGFTAEAVSVTTTTSYQFPEGQKQANESIMPGMEQEGALVSAKIFGPKTRTLQSVSEVRVLKAVDDKGREVKTADLSNAGDYSDSYSDFMPNGKKTANSKPVQCHLALPLPDAKSIEEVTLQAVIQSVGSWKEMTIPFEEGKTNEVDLSEVLPGARLTIKKATFKNMQIAVEGQIKGPETIQQLDLQIKPETDNERFQAQPDFNRSPSRDKTTRRVNLHGYLFPTGGRPSTSPALKILIRLPQDTQRQRIKFTLTGLDLF
jgi:hypothetical protein